MKAVNLLPSDLRSGSRGSSPAVSAGTGDAGGPGAYVVLGVLAAAIVAIAGYVLTVNTVKQRQADLDAVKARSAAVTRQVNELKPYADFASRAKQRVQTINDLAGSRFKWDQALRDVSRAVPSGVTLSDLNGTVSSQSGAAGGSGTSGSSSTGSSGGGSLRGALDVPAIELQGCAKGQTAVAVLMSRLRDVDGVTRVSLSQSDKEAQTARPGGTGAQSAPGSASTGTPDSAASSACGTDHDATFDVVVFFEDDATAAVDPAGSASTGTGGAAANVANAASSVATPTPTPGAAPASGSSSSTSNQGQSK